VKTEMKKISYIFASLLIFGLWQDIFAQNLTFYGFLPAFSQTGRISERVDYPERDLQLYIQPSIIYKFSPNLNASFSYTYQRNNPLEDDYSNEHRLWQQVIFGHNAEKLRFTHRIRFEQRFIENRLTGEYPFSTRLRYQFGGNMPLQGKTLDKNEFYLNAYNEFYFSLTGIKNDTYSENWTYTGVGYNFGKMGRLEMGYLLQFSVRNPQKDLRILNLIQTTWITNFNFTFKKTNEPKS
jgi:hypothetical protein